jgi:WD40 repeat protein
VALGDCDGEVKLWDLPAGKARGSFKMPHAAWEMTFSPNGAFLAAWGLSAGRPHHFWDVAANKLAAPPKILYGMSGSFSPDGKVFVATAATGPDFIKQHREEVAWVEFWSVNRLVKLAKLTVKTDAVFRFVTFSPDGRIVAAAIGGTICLWDVPPLKP